MLLLLGMLFFLYIAQATVKATLNFQKIKANKQSEFQWVSRWISSEQQRHLAQARLTSLVVRNYIRKGLIDRHCGAIGVTGELGLDPEFGEFAIADPEGNISCNSIPWLAGINVADKSYFKQALVRINLGYIEKVDGAKPHQYAAILAHAMRDANGRVEKVILVAVDFSWVAEEIQRVSLPEGAHLLLIDSDNKLIAGSQNMADWEGKDISDTPFYKLLANKKQTTFDGLGFAGADSLIVTDQFNTGSGEIRVAIDMPYGLLLQGAYLEFAYTLLFSTIGFILILGLAYHWSDKYFLRKILAIEGAAKQFSRGKLTTRIKLKNTDELGHLANSLDEMADELYASQEKLKALNDELYRVNRALKVLSAGNKTLLLAKTEQELLDTVCRQIVEMGGYLAVWIGFSGAGQDTYLKTMAAYPKAENSAENLDWNQAGNGLKPVITAVREGRVLVVNDTEHETTHPLLGEQAAKFGYRSIIILPLHLEGRSIGALILSAHRTHEFGDAQVEYLKETASDISFGIEMLRTKGDRNRLALLSEHHEKMLRDGLEDTLAAISRTIEMRDPYTSGHQKRVANLARSLAEELGLSADEAHGIYLASIVHDIGKLTIPAEILVKPGKLSDIEYALVKGHVQASYEILKEIKFPWPIAMMAQQHHERINGTGYPLGLKDGDILFGGRIMAVADVVEAMSSHRPYRAGLGMEAALAEIEKGKNSLYDASVVDACLRLFRDGRFKFD